MCLEVSFLGDFRVSEESRICRFFFPFGLQKSTFSEIMGTAYRTELADYQDSLPLAFSLIFVSFICTIISKFSKLRDLSSKLIKTHRKPRSRTLKPGSRSLRRSSCS